jgi:hypothetical protein
MGARDRGIHTPRAGRARRAVGALLGGVDEQLAPLQLSAAHGDGRRRALHALELHVRKALGAARLVVRACAGGTHTGEGGVRIMIFNDSHLLSQFAGTNPRQDAKRSCQKPLHIAKAQAAHHAMSSS